MKDSELIKMALVAYTKEKWRVWNETHFWDIREASLKQKEMIDEAFNYGVESVLSFLRNVSRD
jgi:hypothetical protein